MLPIRNTRIHLKRVAVLGCLRRKVCVYHRNIDQQLPTGYQHKWTEFVSSGSLLRRRKGIACDSYCVINPVIHFTMQKTAFLIECISQHTFENIYIGTASYNRRVVILTTDDALSYET